MGLFSAIGAVAGGLIGGPAGAALGASLGGGVDGAKAASKAAKAQANAAKDAAGLQHAQYLQTREDFAPWRESGVNALYQLSDLYGVKRPTEFDEDGAVSAWSDPATAQQNAFAAFQTSPGYQFRLDEGNKALDRSAAARGMLLSGNQLKALSRYNQGMASNEYNNYTNRLAALAGVGQSATGSTATAGANAAANQGSALMQAGNARASGYIGQQNAYSGMLNNAFGVWMNRDKF